MATILATWELGLGYGHVANLAPIARGLAKAGHRMPIAAKVAATARAVPGAPFAAIWSAPLYGGAGTQRPTITYGQVIGDGGLNDPQGAIALVEEWLALFDRVQPDAVVSEHAPVSMLAAYVAGLPFAFSGSGFMVPPPGRPLPSLLPWNRHGIDERRMADAEADRTVEAACRAFGRPSVGGIVGLVSRARQYLMTWPEVDVYGVRPGVTYFGPMGGLAASARPDWPAGEGPRVFVYLPFNRPRVPDVIEVLRQLGWPTLWHSQAPPKVALPATIRFAAEPVDLPAALSEAAVFVSRAGHASSCDAVAAGCPQLLLPDTLESLLIAFRLAHHKLGLLRPDEEGPAPLRTTLERLVADPEIGAGVAAAKKRYARYRPAAAAAELTRGLLTDLLGHPLPSRSSG